MHGPHQPFPTRALIVVLFLWAGALPAQEARSARYGEHDVRSVVRATKGEDGKVLAQLDVGAFERIFDDLFAHARNYPPAFRDDEDRARAKADAKALSDLLAILCASKDADPAVVLWAARLEALAHNLDLEGAAGRASACFERVLAKEPDHAKANLYYGAFLGGTAKRQKEAPKYLEKALSLGEEEARYPLGILCAMLGDHAKAIAHLERYAEQNPRDQRVRDLVRALRSGAAASRPSSAKPQSR